MARVEEALANDPSRQQARDDLDRSQRDAEAHRRYALEEAFQRIGEVVWYT